MNWIYVFRILIILFLAFSFAYIYITLFHKKDLVIAKLYSMFSISMIIYLFIYMVMLIFLTINWRENIKSVESLDNITYIPLLVFSFMMADMVIGLLFTEWRFSYFFDIFIFVSLIIITSLSAYIVDSIFLGKPAVVVYIIRHDAYLVIKNEFYWFLLYVVYLYFFLALILSFYGFLKYRRSLRKTALYILVLLLVGLAVEIFFSITDIYWYIDTPVGFIAVFIFGFYYIIRGGKTIELESIKDRTIYFTESRDVLKANEIYTLIIKNEEDGIEVSINRHIPWSYDFLRKKIGLTRLISEIIPIVKTHFHHTIFFIDTDGFTDASVLKILDAIVENKLEADYIHIILYGNKERIKELVHRFNIESETEWELKELSTPLQI